MPDSGTTVRVDGATAFQALSKESDTPGTILNKLKIKIEVGRILNKNKNPIAENSIKEIQKEILRLTGKSGPITPIDLSLVLSNMNNRIRSCILTAHAENWFGVLGLGKPNTEAGLFAEALNLCSAL